MHKNKYQFGTYNEIANDTDINKVVQEFTYNLLSQQCGWTDKECKKKAIDEINRDIPKRIFNYLELYGWNLDGSKVLDVGSGQGGAVLEALYRGADAFGIEPAEAFAKISQLRLNEAGFDVEKITITDANKIPFDNDTFDYVISLQVLEHVPKPNKILKEIYRVLKPGGKCHIRCENYLSFREQHYRIAWLPLLPKFLGNIYLKLIGRDPSFLNHHIFYTTYPQILFHLHKGGFQNRTSRMEFDRILKTNVVTSYSKRTITKLLRSLPLALSYKLYQSLFHLRNFFSVGIHVMVEKPSK